MNYHNKTNNINEFNLTKKILKKNSRIFKNFAKNTQEKLKDFAKKNTQKSPRIFKNFVKNTQKKPRIFKDFHANQNY